MGPVGPVGPVRPVRPVRLTHRKRNKLFGDEPCDSSQPIPFDSARQADYNETLPAPSGYLPADVSAFFSLLTSIGMWTVRNLHPSISLAKRIPTHPVPMLSDNSLKGYPYLCTLVPRISTFTLSRLDLINILVFHL